jgi:hypothetical protein
MEFKAKSTSWGGCNLWENNEVEFFDLTTPGARRTGEGVDGLALQLPPAYAGSAAGRCRFRRTELGIPRIRLVGEKCRPVPVGKLTQQKSLGGDFHARLTLPATVDVVVPARTCDASSAKAKPVATMFSVVSLPFAPSSYWVRSDGAPMATLFPGVILPPHAASATLKTKTSRR